MLDDRLTARNKDGMAYLIHVKSNEQEISSAYPNTLKCIMDAFSKLAQYEDTGYTPDELDYMRGASR